MSAQNVRAALKANADPAKAAFFPRFFKAGPGEYAEGDKFLGVTVPRQRAIAKQFRDLPLKEAEALMHSPWHEERLTALFILTDQFRRGDETTRDQIYHFYKSHTAQVNNWDLVDSSAHLIVGPWLDSKPEKMTVLRQLAQSELLWDRRIAMIATSHYIRMQRAEEALDIAELLLHDSHDLIQKAVGWMLREVGKSVDRHVLLQFLDKHASSMPRTALRYAIEHLPADQKKYYMTTK